MGARSFVDSNVLVYAFDDAAPDKLAVPLDETQAGAAVAELSRLPVVPIDGELTREAVSTSQAAQISYWDALIVEAAATAGCDRLLTKTFLPARRPGPSASRTRSPRLLDRARSRPSGAVRRVSVRLPNDGYWDGYRRIARYGRLVRSGQRKLASRRLLPRPADSLECPRHPVPSSHLRGGTIELVAPSATTATTLAQAPAKGTHMQTSIDINATPQAVWDIVTALHADPEGGRYALPGRMTAETVDGPKSLRWTGKGPAGR